MESDGISFFYWDHSYNSTLLLNFAIVIALFTSIRLFSGVISHTDPSNELTNKDNPAFGISLAGVVLAVTILLTGVLFGNQAKTLSESAIAVGLYGIAGIVLMALTRIIFDRIALPKIHIGQEIIKGNVAASIIDAGNVIATAIVIRAVMLWIEANTLDGILTLLFGYTISQLLLTFATHLHIKLFALTNDGASIQKALENGNKAVALRFAGRRIGLAFAVTAASNRMVYEIYEVVPLLAAWMGISIIMMVILSVFSLVADKIILYKIDTNDEVVRQHNLALGAVQGIIYLSLGFLLTELIA